MIAAIIEKKLFGSFSGPTEAIGFFGINDV
jgi:hypothetical protein